MVELLPVLDLRAGRIVHARGGQRSEYQPLRSNLTAATDPVAVATALAEAAATHHLYVADLDALQGLPPQTEIIKRLLASGLRVWLDAGMSSVAAARTLRHLSVERWIVASETFAGYGELAELPRTFNPNRLVFSVDLRAGRPIGRGSEKTPEELIQSAVAAGFGAVLLLDVAAVGMDEGPTIIPLLRKTRERYPHLELLAGGGVRNSSDVNRLGAAGAHRVLVASALHRGINLRR